MRRARLANRADTAARTGAQGAPSNPTPQDADNGRRHIIPGLILAHTPPSQWVALRGVSKSFRDIIDSRLYEHLIIEPAEGYWSDVLPPTIRGIHGLLPAPPTIEYIGWNAQQETRLWPGQALPATLRTDATQRLRRAKLVDLHRVPPSAAAGRTEAWLCQVLGAIKTLRLFPSANGHYMSSKMVATKVIVYPTAIEPRCGNSWELPPGVQKSVQHLRPQAQDAGILNVCEAQPGVAEEVWLFTDGDPLVESPVELDTWRAKILEWAGNEEAIDPAAADGDQEGTHRPVGGCDMAWRQIIEVATDRVFPHSNNTSQSRLTIVGLETANPVWLGFPRLSKGKDLEERLMRDLAVSLEDNDEMDPALLVGAMNQVRFITYEEYDKEVGPEARELEAFPLYVSGDASVGGQPPSTILTFNQVVSQGAPRPCLGKCE